MQLIRIKHWLGAIIGGTAILTSTLLHAQEVKPQSGGVLLAIANPEPPSLILALQQVGVTQLVAGKIFESLLTYSFDLKPQPSLAKSWTISDDKLTYTFKLQENVVWHDGKPFSSADVVFSYQKVLGNMPRNRGWMQNVASITAPDKNTVVFKMKEPYAAFLYALDVGGGAILPKHLYDTKDPIEKNPNNNHPIGTGPFKFKRWEKGSYIELVKNEQYWQAGKPYLDGITYRIIPDAAARRLALEKGTVHQAWLHDLQPNDIVQVSKLPHLERIQKGYEYWAPVSWIEINQGKAPYNDKRFRQALMYAINHEFISDKILLGTTTIGTGPIHEKTRFYDGQLHRYAYDPKKAEALLDDMGLKPDSKGVRLQTTLIPMPYGETERRVAEYVKQNLAKVGIMVTLENTDIGGWVSRVGNWDYDLAINAVYQYGDPAIGVARTYIGSNIKKGLMFSNTSQYNNPKIDTLFDQAAKALTDDERAKIYSEIQKILIEDVPVAWLTNTNYSTILNKRVHNAITTGLGAVDTYSDAWLEPEKK